MYNLYENQHDADDYENVRYPVKEKQTTTSKEANKKKTGKTKKTPLKENKEKKEIINKVALPEVDDGSYVINLDDGKSKDHESEPTNVPSKMTIPSCGPKCSKKLFAYLIFVMTVAIVMFLMWSSLQNVINSTSHLMESKSNGMQGLKVSMKDKGNMTYLQKYYFNIGMRNDLKLQECQGPQLKRSFPNIDYALLGYNVLRGFPMATGHDPGFTLPIFKASYEEGKQTADCRFSIPSGYVVIPDVSCVTSFTSKTVKSKFEFSQSLSVAANAHGGGWGVQFAASVGYKEASSEMAARESVMILSTAKCNYYFSKLQEYSFPPFHETFLHRISLLEKSTNKQDFFDFFDSYGTHFVTMVTFGASYTYEYIMTSDLYEKKREKGINVGVQASYAGVISVGGGFNLDSSQQQKASEFMQGVETRTVSVGAAPPANGDALQWASTVKDNPVPTRYSLESIENLFTEKYFQSVSIDYQKISEKIKKHKGDYCISLREKGEIDSCEDLHPGIMLKRTQLAVPQTITKKLILSKADCVQKCLDDENCIAIDYCDRCSKSDRSYMTCSMYSRNLTNAIARKSQNHETIVFTSKLNQHEVIQDSKVKGTPRQLANASLSMGSEEDCLSACLDDAHCVAVTSVYGAATKNKCSIYAEGGIIGLEDASDQRTHFISRYSKQSAQARQ